jgi:hypothetical protein
VLATHVLAIQERLERGERLPELVAAEGQGEDLILIEGHCRRQPTSAWIGAKTFRRFLALLFRWLNGLFTKPAGPEQGNDIRNALELVCAVP